MHIRVLTRARTYDGGCTGERSLSERLNCSRSAELKSNMTSRGWWIPTMPFDECGVPYVTPGESSASARHGGSERERECATRRVVRPRGATRARRLAPRAGPEQKPPRTWLIVGRCPLEAATELALAGIYLRTRVVALMSQPAARSRAPSEPRAPHLRRRRLELDALRAVVHVQAGTAARGSAQLTR